MTRGLTAGPVTFDEAVQFPQARPMSFGHPRTADLLALYLRRHVAAPAPAQRYSPRRCEQEHRRALRQALSSALLSERLCALDASVPRRNYVAEHRYRAGRRQLIERCQALFPPAVIERDLRRMLGYPA